MNRFYWLGLVAGLALTGCDDLPDIPALTCGNALVEPGNGEVCDTFAPTNPDGTASLCGAANSTQACQFIHDVGHTCPPGYGAGLDGLCRVPKGTFTPIGSLLPVTGETTVSEDFDGNGFADILFIDTFGSDVRVAYLGEQTSYATTAVATPVSLLAPVVGDLNGDGLPDLAINSLSGISVRLGRKDQSFSGKLYSPIVVPEGAIPVPIPITAYSGPTSSLYGQYVPGALVQTGPNLSLVTLTDPPSVAGTVNGASLGSVLGVTIVDLDPPFLFGDGAEEIAITLQTAGGGRIAVVSPGIDTIPSSTLNAFGSPTAPIESPPYRLGADVGVLVHPSNDRYKLARYGLVAGFMVNTPGADINVAGPSETAGLKPIAVAQSGDLFPFVVAVTPRDIRVLRANDPPVILGESTGLESWTVAALDIASGRRVVVAGSSEASGLDVFLNTGLSASVTALRMQTTAPPRALEVADFDGDGSKDFLVHTRAGDARCDDDSRLSVSWGATDGYPSPPQDIGNLPALGKLWSGTVIAAGKLDGAADFVGTTFCNETATQRQGVFFGGANRQVDSPYPLTETLVSIGEDVENLGLTPMGIADLGSPGAGPDGRDDLLSLALANGSIVLQVRYGIADADFELGPAFPILETTDEQSIGSIFGSGHLIPVDLENDGDVDILLVGARAAGVDWTPEVYVGINENGSLTFAPAARAMSFAYIGGIGLEQFQFGALLSVEVALSDLDGDEIPDLVVSFRSADALLLSTGGTYVFPGFGNGFADGSGAPPPLSSDARAIVDLTGKVPGASLAVASSEGVSLCGFASATFSCGDPLLVDDPDDVTTSLTVGDFDGDGVVDLAVSRPSGTVILRQETEQDDVASL